VESLIKSGIKFASHTILQPLERRLLDQCKDSYIPPCFIIGAPRSGTSLLYELLVTYYKFSYFSNLANIFFKTPLAVSYIGKPAIERRKGRFESSYGNLHGFAAPSEAGAIWGRWIPEFHYLDQTSNSKHKFLIEAPAIVQSMSWIFSAPFINKNVMHGVHMNLLNVIFPGCVFIEIRRDARANARSIINARVLEAGPKQDKDGWWSVKPRGASKYFGLTPEEQACAQISLLRHDIEDSVNYLGDDRYLMINYEDVCSKTSYTLSVIRDFLMPHCGDLDLRNVTIDNIACSNSTPLADESEIKIQNSLVAHGLD